MNADNGVFYEFGDFRIDIGERTLLHDGEPVPLAPKVFDTLLLLIGRPGHVFSKREMMDAIWADFFVEESNLTQNIYTLRCVLGNSGDGTRYIENVPRRGYRFAAEVRTLRFDDERLRKAELPSHDDSVKRSNTRATISPVFTVTPLRLAAAAIVFGLAVFAAYRFYPGKAEKPATAPIETVILRKLTFTGDLLYPIISPDGRLAAFVRDEGLFVLDVDSGEETLLTIEGPQAFGILQFSPDGQFIYFRDRQRFDAAGSIFRVSRFGGAASLVAQNAWSGPGFSPDAKQISFNRNFPAEGSSSLVIKHLETGDERNLTTLNLPNEFLDNGHAAWSPDGRNIAVVTFKKLRQASASFLNLVDAATGKMTELNVPQIRQFEQVAWLPDSSGLIISAREDGKFFQLWRLSLPSLELRRITNDLNIYRGVSLSRDGKKLLARQFTLYSHLWIGDKNDLENSTQKTFGNLSRDGVNGIAWIPDGDIVYSARIMGDQDLWLYRPADDTRRQLTKNTGNTNRDPAVSPDGKLIFFNSNRSGTNQIWRMDASGGNQTQITAGENDSTVFPQLSTDGQWLYYIQKSPTASTVWRRSLTGGPAEPLTEPGKLAPDSFLSLSPDGKTLAFHNAIEKVNEEAGKQTYQISLIATDPRSAPRFLEITASRLAVRWSPDGTALDYIENTADRARIWRQSIAAGTRPTLVTEFRQAFLHNFEWSADGQKLALSRGRQLNDAILLTNF